MSDVPTSRGTPSQTPLPAHASHEGQPTNVHHGRYSRGDRLPSSRGRLNSPQSRRTSVPGYSIVAATHRPPGAAPPMLFRLREIMNGVDYVAVPLPPLVLVACNSGAVRACRCRLFSANLPSNIFWYLTGNGIVRCAPAHHNASPLRGVEDQPRIRSPTGRRSLLPQAMYRPQGLPFNLPLPLNGSSPCATFFGRRPRVTDLVWAPRADRG